MPTAAKVFLLSFALALCSAAIFRLLTAGSSPAVTVAGIVTVGILAVTSLPPRDAEC